MEEHSNVLQIEGIGAKKEKTEEADNSYFKEEYKQAFQVVQSIIEQNLKRKDRRLTERYQIHNIVPFIGKRGSGKTSAMMSFSGMLERYFEERQREQKFCFRGLEGEEIDAKFICLDCIDGSLLEKGEDIFKLILAQMYRKFFEEDRGNYSRDVAYDQNKRKLQEEFDEVFHDACQMELKSVGDRYYEESPITSLRNLSSSFTVTEGFETLAKEYLEFFNFVNGRKTYKEPKQFLVIIVDDLDLNIFNGYEMLEKIHRYMMVENVIILLSVDYDQIKLLCEKQFYNMVPAFDTKLNEEKNYIEHVSRDFLDKVFPGNVRVYMPLLNKMDNVMIREKDGSSSKTVKKAIFSLIYDKLGIRLDVEGTKRHFYEQNTLRTMVSFYLMLKEMKSLDENDTSTRLQTFEHNYKLLMFDTLNRMVDERLNHEYKEIFNNITNSDLVHAARNLYITIVRYSKGEDKAKDPLVNLAENIRKAGYSYGELLRIIYCWGRINSESKEMIRCLLAYYTEEFHREYEKGNINQIIKSINGSALGSWANKFVPKIRDTGGTLQEIGYKANLRMETVFKFNLTEMIDLIDLGKEASEDFFEENGIKLVRTMLCLSMFFEQPELKKEQISFWRIQKQKISEEQIKLNPDLEKQSLIVGTGMANFNILGFVTNALEYKDKVNPLIEDLCDIVFESAQNKKLKDKAQKEIKQEFEIWYQKSKGFALPLYDMDVTYNLIKRLRQEKGEISEVKKEEFWNSWVKLCQSTYKKLKANDKWYEELGIDLKGKKFAENFLKCPYISWLFEEKHGTLVLSEDSIIKDYFQQCFKILIQSVITGETASTEEREIIIYRNLDD